MTKARGYSSRHPDRVSNPGCRIDGWPLRPGCFLCSVVLREASVGYGHVDGSGDIGL
jgi:hypothetical protein